MLVLETSFTVYVILPFIIKSQLSFFIIYPKHIFYAIHTFPNTFPFLSKSLLFPSRTQKFPVAKKDLAANSASGHFVCPKHTKKRRTIGQTKRLVFCRPIFCLFWAFLRDGKTQRDKTTCWTQYCCYCCSG